MGLGNINRGIKIWNRKFHIYIGFYFLLFIWLFSISGLIKNHPKWNFAEYWSKREQTSIEKPIQIPTGKSDLEKAKNIMSQLNISGEVTWTVTYPSEDKFNFRVMKPGKIIDIKTDIPKKLSTIEQISVNSWGIMNMLHNFTGVRMDDSNEKRDWLVTKLWSFFMDAVCLGFIILILTGVFIWCYQKHNRRAGIFALSLGVLICAFFIFGISWMT